MSCSEGATDLEWDAYVESHPEATIYHTSAWQEVIQQAFGKDTVRLCSRDEAGSISGVLPLVMQQNILLGKNLLSVPYSNYGGPLGDDTKVCESLAVAASKYSDEQACKSLELRDFANRSYEGFAPRTDKVMMRLDLPESPEALQKAIGAKVRSQIRRPQRENVSVQHGSSELVNEFYPVFCRNLRDLGTPVYPQRFFDTIIERLGDRCHVIVVRIDNTVVAACFLIGHRDVLEIPWAASNRDYNRLGVNMLLYWEALSYAFEKGYKVFDFGRSTTEGGTFRFKKQWGAVAYPLTWHRKDRSAGSEPQHGPTMADRAVEVWKRLPLPVANWLGPKVSPDLPW